MFQRILVCSDGSAGAVDAAASAASIALSFGSEVVALNVFHMAYADPANIGVWAITVDPDVIRRCADEEREVVEPTLMPIFKKLGIPCRFIQEAGHEAEVDAILRVADREKVDLIVLGSRGMRGIKELLLGSVSSGVLNHATCPVLIVRGENAPCGTDRFDNILLVSDGSPCAQSAAKVAVEIARKFAITLTALNVYEDLSSASLPGDEDKLIGDPDPVLYAKQWMEYVAQPIRELAAAAHVDCAFAQEGGRPDETIVDFANQHDVDLIVIGSRGLGGYSRLLIGSVSNRVVHHSNCPVLVVRSTK